MILLQKKAVSFLQNVPRELLIESVLKILRYGKMRQRQKNKKTKIFRKKWKIWQLLFVLRESNGFPCLLQMNR